MQQHKTPLRVVLAPHCRLQSANMTTTPAENVAGRALQDKHSITADTHMQHTQYTPLRHMHAHTELAATANLQGFFWMQ
jgi:hypothetical protein